MEDIFVKETETTPEVSFNYQQGLLEIKGVSIPEDTEEFYTFLLDYIQLYIESPKSKTTTILLKLIYINTASSAILARIIKNFEVLNKNPSFSVAARWYYERGDEDMKEIGLDFKGFSSLPLSLMPCDEII